MLPKLKINITRFIRAKSILTYLVPGKSCYYIVLYCGVESSKNECGTLKECTKLIKSFPPHF